MKKNKPIRTLWHGNVKANIWANATQSGEMYTVNYARIYTDKHGQVQEAYTFTDIENLRLEALAREANNLCNQLRQEYNARSRSEDDSAPVEDAMPTRRRDAPRRAHDEAPPGLAR